MARFCYILLLHLTINLMKHISLITLALLLPFMLVATDLRISEVELTQHTFPEKALSLQLTVSWENAWNNAKNHDAAWVFGKLVAPSGGSYHLALLADGHTLVRNNKTDAPPPRIEVSKDGTGCFIYTTSPYRGPVSWTIRLQLDATIRGQVNVNRFSAKAYGLEMVYVPEGAFSVGDKDTTALHFAGMYQANNKGDMAAPFRISSEDELIVGKAKGNLYYPSQNQYRGDQKGPIPAAFPKGYQAFYVMKYEITQGQYTDFLNTLYATATYFRSNFAGRGYAESRGSIKLMGNTYVATAPLRPLNFVSWEDGCAFADWAGLRPMTEFEFTKACRGPSEPLAHEYPWGTSNRNNVERRVGLDDNLTLASASEEAHLADETREKFGASYYWVMDLAGSLWERVVSIGHPIGREFQGSHGDGTLSGHGFATNEDWPKGDEEIGGYGYRGGGYYEHHKPASEFNPHSPIAYRPYGAWAGGPRSIAYGFRCVRTAEGD